jgi:peroxiredoxin family protein
MEASNQQDLMTRFDALEAQVAQLKRQVAEGLPKDQVSIICFSGDWDRLFAALTLASGALAMGQEVHLFFTFWGVPALRKGAKAGPCPPKDLSQAMMSGMLPCGPCNAKLSKMNFLGLGKMMLRRLMKKQGVDDIDVLMREVRELGAHIHLCETSAALFGLSKGELADNEEINQCGVATFMGHAMKSRFVLFI